MPALANWSMPSMMARHMKFVPPNDRTPAVTDAYSHGVHVDAGLYAGCLRDHAVARGAQRIEGRVAEVAQHPETGVITAYIDRAVRQDAAPWAQPGFTTPSFS